MSHSHSQLRDPAIKLFGRNIPLTDSNIPAIHHQSSMDECVEEEATKAKDDDAVEKPCEHDSHEEAEASRDAEEDVVGPKSDKCGGKEKALKKPDRLIPCPRCNSLETKFCYFNNYNVNQPRHFCKNCHRYWTAGGTIRNVPVGAGRRRNSKQPSSLQPPRQASADVAVAVQGDTCSDGAPSSDSPLCETMESKLNLKDPKNGDACEEPSSSSCSSSRDNGCQANEDNADPARCYPVPQWAYPWNPGWNVMMVGPNTSYPGPLNVGGGSVPMVTVPGFCPPNVPLSFVPGSYWGYVPGWEAGKWISPVLGSVSPSSSTSNGSPTLGKHSRDVSSKTDETTEKCLWVPKTLRIDDPNEAAKSSIWSTLGIEPEKSKGFTRSGIFKPFKHKSDGGDPPNETDADQVLQSNPAALSRSHSFQEST